ncbi:MAG: hypothetical protein JJE47_09535 [Acidimicrobiia bacterium]|nr:hypothetical protein [Acidimicrobiia bacterium]
MDLWIQWSEAEDTMDVRLEHWGIRQLAERYCDASLVGAVDVALLGPADMASRVDVIARILEQSLAAAGSQ